MSALTVYVDGAGLWSPHLADFAALRGALQGEAASPPPARPPATLLPAAERRRAPESVLLAVEVAGQAVAMSGREPASLPCVFASSHGDQPIMDYMCTVLASAPAELSPTRFHNSVHNAPAGYWSISSQAMATSSVLCAHDGSFAAGLLEAMVQAVVEDRPVLLLAYDTEYPEPLRDVRPIPHTMGVALLVSPRPGPRTVARISLPRDAAFTTAPARTMDEPLLEQLRSAIPTARSLPLLQALASGELASVVIDYLDGLRLAMRVEPC